MSNGNVLTKETAQDITKQASSIVRPRLFGSARILSNSINCNKFPESVQQATTQRTWVGDMFKVGGDWWLSIQTHDDACQDTCRNKPYRKIYFKDGTYSGLVLGQSNYEKENWACCEAIARLPPILLRFRLLITLICGR